MPTITDLLIDQLGAITTQFISQIGEPSHVLDSIRDGNELGDIGIHDFPILNDIENKTMVAVDGANTTQKLSVGDLIVVGATVGEASDSRRLYPTADDAPAEAHSIIVRHSSENDNLEQSIRGAMELRLLATSPADFAIIDGGWLGNTSALLFGLFGKSTFSTNQVMDFLDDDKSHAIRDALELLTRPAVHPTRDIVAVVKSDSSREYSKEIFGEDSPLSEQISDRVLASRVLAPGEFFTPRALISARQVVNLLHKYAEGDKLEKHLKGIRKARRTVLLDIYAGKEGNLRALDNSREKFKSVLWTTYFKPATWSRWAPAIRIEFSHHAVETGVSAKARAGELIGTLNQDFASEEFLEPWCQYEADKRAKGVSLATDIVKSHLISATLDEHLALGMLRGYRT